jgi:hypothetical protein
MIDKNETILPTVGKAAPTKIPDRETSPKPLESALQVPPDPPETVKKKKKKRLGEGLL